MSYVLYVGGSKDGKKSFVPYGFSKTQADTAQGPEIYVERTFQVNGRGPVRVMALEALNDESLALHMSRHYA